MQTKGGLYFALIALGGVDPGVEVFSGEFDVEQGRSGLLLRSIDIQSMNESQNTREMSDGGSKKKKAKKKNKNRVTKNNPSFALTDVRMFGSLVTTMM